jgi:hypothetical protein
MRRRLTLLAVAGGLGLAAVPAALASPPSNHGTQTACAAIDNDTHGSQGGQQAGPPEDSAGTAAAEAVLGCNDNDNG